MAQWSADYQLFKSSPDVSFLGTALVCSVTCKYQFNYNTIKGSPTIQKFQDEHVISIPIEDGGTVIDEKSDTTYTLKNIMLIAPAKYVFGTAARSKGQLILVHHGEDKRRLFVSILLDESSNTSDQLTKEYKFFQKLSGYVNPSKDTTEYGKIVSYDLTDLLPDNNNYYLFKTSPTEQHLVFQNVLTVPSEFINSLIRGIGINLRQFQNLINTKNTANPIELVLFSHRENKIKIYREPTDSTASNCNQQNITGNISNNKSKSPVPDLDQCPGPKKNPSPSPSKGNAGPSIKEFWGIFIKFLLAMTFAVIIGLVTLYGSYLLIMKYCWFYSHDLKNILVSGVHPLGVNNSNADLSGRRTIYLFGVGILAIIYILGFVLLAWNNYDINNFWKIFGKIYSYIVSFPLILLCIWAGMLYLSITRHLQSSRVALGIRSVPALGIKSNPALGIPSVPALGIPSNPVALGIPPSTVGLAVVPSSGSSLAPLAKKQAETVHIIKMKSDLGQMPLSLTGGAYRNNNGLTSQLENIKNVLNSLLEQLKNPDLTVDGLNKIIIQKDKQGVLINDIRKQLQEKSISPLTSNVKLDSNSAQSNSDDANVIESEIKAARVQFNESQKVLQDLLKEFNPRDQSGGSNRQKELTKKLNDGFNRLKEAKKALTELKKLKPI